MRRRAAILCLLAFAVVFHSACDAPGKPPIHAKEAEEANENDFDALFARNCSGCHGFDGKNGPGRILHDPLYLAVIPKSELRNVIAHGRQGTSMPAWSRVGGGGLSDKQINILVEGIEKNWSKPSPPPVPPLPAYYAKIGSGDKDRGKLLFAQNCLLCHRPGVIGPVSTPAYLSLVTDQNLRTSIIVGRPDLGMLSYRNLKMGRALTEQDISDIVSYLSSLRPANTETQNAAVTDTGTGPSGEVTKGNEGSGNTPRDGRKDQRVEGPKANGGSSQGGGLIEQSKK